MKKHMVFLILVPSMLLAGCMFPEVQGSGNVVSETRTVSGFNSVELSGDGKLEIEQTGTESLTVTADDNILKLLKSEVSAGRLVLKESTDYLGTVRKR
jgi:hypothetical protein